MTKRIRIASALLASLACVPGVGAGSAEPAQEDETPFSGITDVCDGRDNNLDGWIDEGCDAVCDNERLASTSSQFTNDAASSSAPDIVFAGNQYGIAWIDTRAGYPRMCYARMDRNGAKIGSDVCVFGSNVTGVAIGWSGSEFLVAVVDTGNLYAVRVAASGGYNGATKLNSTTGTVTGLSSSGLAWVGSQYALTWSDNRLGTEHVYVAGVSSGGARTSSEFRVDASTATASGSSIALGRYGSGAPLTTGYGVAWTDTRDGGQQIYFARLGTNFINVGGADLLLSAGTYTPNGGAVVGWTGSEYGVAFTTNGSSHPPAYSPRIDFTRVSPAGTIVAGPVRLSTGTSTGGPSLAWTGAEYLLAWSRDLCISPSPCPAYAARMDADGTVHGSYALSSSGWSWPTSIVWSGSDAAVVWANDGPGNLEIFTNRLVCCDDVDADGYNECDGDGNDAAASVHPGAAETCNDVDDDCDGVVDEVCDGSCDDPRGGTPLRVSVANAESLSPSVLSWNGSVYAAAWADLYADCSFRRIDAAGQPLGNAVGVADCTGVRSLVWTGADWGLKITTATGGALARFDGAGNLLSRTPAVDAADVWTGAEYGAAYSVYVGPGYEWRLNRMDRAGNQLGDPMKLIYPVDRIAWNGTGYGAIYGNGVDITFTKFDRFGLSQTVPKIVSTGTGNVTPDIVWTGSEYGVVWNYRPQVGVVDNIRFRRLDGNGDPIGTEVAITNWSGHSWLPRIVWTGGEYGISWQDDHNGGNVVYLARVSPAGTLLQTRAISGGGYEDSNVPSLVWNGREYAVAYSHLKYLSPGVPDGEWEAWFQRVPCFGNDADGDGALGSNDCNDQDASVWARPGEARSLLFSSDKASIVWAPPAAPGATAVVYDTVRAGRPDDFVNAATCVETNDGANTTAIDAASPAPGAAFFYLVRAENACPAPDGQGPLGHRSNGQETQGRTCP